MSDEINPYNAAPPTPSGSPFAPSPGEVSEVAYDLNVDDMVAFGVFHLCHSATERPGRRIVTVLAALFAVAAAPFAYFAWARGDPFTLFINLLLVAACVVFRFGVYHPWLVRRYCRLTFRPDRIRAVLGPNRLRISSIDLSESSELLETNAKWAAVESIEWNENYVYIVVAFYHFFVVPRRAFNDDLQFQAFVELARRYWRQATGAPNA